MSNHIYVVVCINIL